MSTHDKGLGGKIGRSSGFELDCANAPGGQSWGSNATNNQKSEVPFMAQGAGRPGQPNIGQGSIFGNGSAAFTQMPTYTPVTRGPAPQQPQAPQPTYAPQPANPQPTQARPQAPAQRAPQPPAAPSFQAPRPQPQAFGNDQQYQPPFPSSGKAASFGTQSPAMPDLSHADPGFPESIFPDFKTSDASFAESDFSTRGASFADHSYSDQGYADQNYSDQNYSDPNYSDPNYSDPNYGDQSYGDASFPEEGGDASFQEMNYAASPEPGLGGGDAMFGGDNFSHGAMADGGTQHFAPAQPQGHMPQQAYHPEAGKPQMPQSDPRRQLQAYDSAYDQPPQIALGGHAPNQGYFEADRSDADFLDESQVLPASGGRSKLTKSLRGRSAFMVASALLGAIALGGALAYAYKQSGGGMANGETPMVTADARPVKEAPDQPGGKEFPHKNKLIYDRLTNGDAPESERIVPRQEDVAVPALPPASATAGLPPTVASTDLANPGTTESVGAADDDGGPRKVKTMVVRPDGSVQAPPADTAVAAAAPAEAEPAPAGMMPVPTPEAPAPQAAAPAPQHVASVDPKPAPANTKYVVQVGAKKSQTDALATFADIQQKYPKLLSNYRPIVQKADLGSKGVWYRLRVGPIDDKTEAYKLCGQLKSQGLPDCLVMSQ
jgi:cell division septation protein DedD